ncbi:MAG: MFS transporter [Elusimicrobiota bacterium]
MIEYLRFLMGNKRLISFGFSMTFFSSFGQTFLISLYVPHLIKEFNLNNSSFGFIYSAATICSSIALIYLGKYIDHKSLRNYTLASAALLIFSCLLTAFSMNIIFIFAGLLGLRLSGQGLFSHISKTSISKKFSKARGKALSLSVLGYSFGEGIFPLVISSLIAILGWRGSMAASSVFIALFLIPFIFFALNKNEFKAQPKLNREKKGKNNFSRKELFREQGFYILALNTVILPALITGLFFYQMTLAAEKGWARGWLPACFLAYAAGRTIFSLLSGKLIDKFTAAKLLPLYLIPFLIGLLALVFASHPLVAPFYLALTGISMGMGSTIKSAIAAEAYGTRNLGSIMSLLAMFMVFGTAVTPVLFGFLLDRI